MASDKKAQKKKSPSKPASQRNEKKDEQVDKYKVYFELGAQNEFGDLDPPIRDTFAEPIKRMKQRPTQDATHLRNVKSVFSMYKKRVGDLRIFFAIDTANRQVVVLSIKKRDSDTYDPTILEGIAARYSGPHKEQPKRKQKR